MSNSRLVRLSDKDTRVWTGQLYFSFVPILKTGPLDISGVVRVNMIA